jgi:hypothetical protein
MKVETRGAVGDLAKLSKVSLSSKVTGVDIRTLLATWLPTFDYAKPLGKLEGAFKLADRNGAWTLSGLSLVGGTSTTPLEFAVNGAIADITGNLSADLDARFRLGDSALMKSLTGIALKPVSGSLVVATSPGQVRGTLRGQLGDTRLDGDGVIALAEQQITGVKLTLATPHLYLQDFALDGSRKGSQEDATPAADESGFLLTKLGEKAPPYPVDLTLSFD